MCFATSLFSYVAWLGMFSLLFLNSQWRLIFAQLDSLGAEKVIGIFGFCLFGSLSLLPSTMDRVKDLGYRGIFMLIFGSILGAGERRCHVRTERQDRFWAGRMQAYRPARCSWFSRISRLPRRMDTPFQQRSGLLCHVGCGRDTSLSVMVNGRQCRNSAS